MSFADDLRKITPRDPEAEKKKLRLDALAKDYVSAALNQCQSVAQKGQRQISGFAVNNGYYLEWIEDLLMHYGTAEQRAAERKKCAKEFYSKYGSGTTKNAPVRYGLELFDRADANRVAAMVSSELKKKGFTHYQVQVLEFHNVISVRKTSFFGLGGTDCITYQEVPGTYYYLRISIRW